MYEKAFTKIIEETVGGIKHCTGDVFWVNNTTIPNQAHVGLARGVSN